MTPPLDDLAPGRIQAALVTRFIGRALEVRASTASTMDDARDAASGQPDGFVVVADHQTGGRGSHGRVWESPPGTDLYFSVVVRPGMPLSAMGALTLSVGLGVAEAVEALVPDAAAEVKWPNDVLLDRAKCAGILVESRASTSTPDLVVIGVGVNVNRRAFPPELVGAATSLALKRPDSEPLDRAVALAQVLAGIERWYDRFLADGASAVVPAVEARLCFRGQQVRCGGEQGTLLGLSTEGALRILTADGEKAVVAGRVEPTPRP